MIEIQGAIRGEHGSDVPCDGCTACCTSSQFIHVGPDESDTTRPHPGGAVVSRRPGCRPGHVVLGYDERGHCPMLIDDQCSIYEHRPRTCRTYDCRIFPAAGLEIDDADKIEIARRVQRWRFSYPAEADRQQHDAVRAAARLLQEQAGRRTISPFPRTRLSSRFARSKRSEWSWCGHLAPRARHSTRRSSTTAHASTGQMSDADKLCVAGLDRLRVELDHPT